jgi:transcription elongation factor GreA
MANDITPEGLEKLKKELDYLVNIERKKIAKLLAKAISFGDLSENAAYSDAKEQQAFLEKRIKELETMIKEANVVKKDTNSCKVQVGSTVFLDSDKGEDKYIIVGASEASPFENKISYKSPLGQALLNKKEGDIIEIQTPKGKVKYTIKKIE